MVSKNKHKINKALQDALILCQRGQLNDARNIYKKLIKVIPAHDQMLANFGTIELQLGNIRYAIELLDRSISINPNQPNILNNLGNYYLQAEDLEKSIKYFEMAINLNKKDFNAFYNMGRAMTEINKINEAIHCYKEAIKINPENKMAHLNLGFVFNLAMNFDEAIIEYNNAIDLDKKFSDAFYNRGVVYANQNNHMRAIEDFNKAIKLESNKRFIFKRARSYEEIENYAQALADYNLIIELEPYSKDISKAYCRRGDLQNQMGNLEKGMPDIETAIKLEPDNPDFYNDYANGFKKLNQNDKATEYYKYAINLDPKNYRSRANLAYLELAQYNFEAGWELNESRWKIPKTSQVFLNTKKPILKNFNVTNKKILIWGEQGVGDQILYSTMLKDALSTSNRFIVVIDPRLIFLFEDSFKDYENVVFKEREDDEDSYDFHIPIGSLGKFFRTSEKDFLNPKSPLLIPDKKYIKKIKNKINTNKKYLCGISWMSKNKAIGKCKSIDLKDFKSILSLPNIDFVDLQYGDTKEEKKSLKDDEGLELIEMADIDNFNDIDKLACLIDVCDFVITTSNVTAHLAGALNKKTYLIVPFTEGRIWYWGTKENFCLWYPSITIFKSVNLNSWKEPIANLSKKLLKELN